LNCDSLLDTVVTLNASDLHLTVGLPPMLRLHGRLKPIEGDILGPEDVKKAVRFLAPEKNLREMESSGSSDFGYSYGDKARFRISIYRQKQQEAVALRLIPSRIMSVEEIGLPASLKKILAKKRGLILVTGPTGSGKTTTLAAMIDVINSEMDRHIITIEDPIEYYHEHKSSVITQREIGDDATSFPDALRAALRQDPDVILVGEMRDNETISTALRAAETGHLVLGTLHTTGSSRTVDRIIDSFSPDFQDYIRSQISYSVEAVISQVLIPRIDGTGVIAAFEVMTKTPAIGNHIRKCETFKIASAIQTSRKYGMILLDDFIVSLVKEGKISVSDAVAFAQNPAELESKVGYMGEA